MSSRLGNLARGKEPLEPSSPFPGTPSCVGSTCGPFRSTPSWLPLFVRPPLRTSSTRQCYCQSRSFPYQHKAKLVLSQCGLYRRSACPCSPVDGLLRTLLRHENLECSDDTHPRSADMPVLTNSKTPNTGATTRTSVDDAESQSFEMDDSTLLGNDQEAEQRPAESRKSKSITSGLARHTLGLILLLCVVFLWTTSNFLGSVSFCLLYQTREVAVILIKLATEYICGQKLCKAILFDISQHLRFHIMYNTSISERRYTQTKRRNIEG